MKNYKFWVIVDEHGDIVDVHHRSFGDMKAVFSEKGVAEAALASSIRSTPEHVRWRVVVAEIVEPEGE